MEKQSQNNGQRRRRNNRSGGGNRNRQNHQNSRPGGNRSGGNRNSRNRNRNRNRSRRRRQPKPTAWQKFLSFISFGALGKPQKKGKKRPAAKKKPAPASQQPKSSPPKKKRARTEVTSPRLYVGNLDYSTTEGQLEELFRGIGNVQSAEVVTNSRTQQSKGFAFVEMVSIDEAKRAVDVLDDEEFMGRKLIVSGARSDGPHSSESNAPDQNEEAPEPALSETSSDSES